MLRTLAIDPPSSSGGFLGTAELFPFAERLFRNLPGEELRPGEAISVNTLTGEFTSHTVQPVPGVHDGEQLAEQLPSWIKVFPGHDAVPSLTVPDFSADPLFGPIVDVRNGRRQEGSPDRLVSKVSIAGFLGRILPWSADVSGSGYDEDPKVAEMSAVGESVERYCGNYIPLERLKYCSYEELLQAGCDVFSPVYFGANAFKGMGLRDFRDNEAEYWVEAFDLIDGHLVQPVYVPAEVAYLNLTRVSRARSQVPVMLAGIAAGSHLLQAARNAFDELVERDASMRWWYGGLPAKAIEPSLAVGRALASLPRGWELTLGELDVDISTGTRIVVAVLDDRINDRIQIGFGARSSVNKASEKALAEAWQLMNLLDNLDNPESDLWELIRSGVLPMPVVPYRPDRSYSRIDNAGMTQLGLHLQYYLDPDATNRARIRLASILKGGQPEVRADGQKLVPQVKFADLTTPDFRAKGFSVVRAISPDLVGNYQAAYLPYWHSRMAGLASEASDIPMPHA